MLASSGHSHGAPTPYRYSRIGGPQETPRRYYVPAMSRDREPQENQLPRQIALRRPTMAVFTVSAALLGVVGPIERARAENTLDVTQAAFTTTPPIPSSCTKSSTTELIGSQYLAIPTYEPPKQSELVLAHSWEPLFDRSGLIGCVHTITPGPAISARPRLARSWKGIKAIRSVLFRDAEGQLSQPAWDEIIRVRIRPETSEDPSRIAPAESDSAAGASESTNPSLETSAKALPLTHGAEKLQEYFERVGGPVAAAKTKHLQYQEEAHEYVVHVRDPGEFDDIILTFLTGGEARQATRWSSLEAIVADGLRPRQIIWRTEDTEFIEQAGDSGRTEYTSANRVESGDETVGTRETVFFPDRVSLLKSRGKSGDELKRLGLKAIRQEEAAHGQEFGLQRVIWEKRDGVFHEYKDDRYSNDSLPRKVAIALEPPPKPSPYYVVKDSAYSEVPTEKKGSRMLLSEIFMLKHLDPSRQIWNPLWPGHDGILVRQYIAGARVADIGTRIQIWEDNVRLEELASLRHPFIGAPSTPVAEAFPGDIYDYERYGSTLSNPQTHTDGDYIGRLQSGGFRKLLLLGDRNRVVETFDAPQAILLPPGTVLAIEGLPQLTKRGTFVVTKAFGYYPRDGEIPKCRRVIEFPLGGRLLRYSGEYWWPGGLNTAVTEHAADPLIEVAEGSVLLKLGSFHGRAFVPEITEPSDLRIYTKKGLLYTDRKKRKQLYVLEHSDGRHVLFLSVERGYYGSTVTYFVPGKAYIEDAESLPSRYDSTTRPAVRRTQKKENSRDVAPPHVVDFSGL